jgi:uncharacterized membrane protein HdeD (DUF308 family)
MAVFAWPEMTSSGFVYLFGLYTMVDGMVALAIALEVKALRGVGSLVSRRWSESEADSLRWVLVTPVTVDVPALRWLVGPYALIFGVTLVALARRLRQLAHEMQAA